MDRRFVAALVAVLVGALVVAFLITDGGEGPAATEVEVEGPALAPLPASGPDPAVGEPLPVLSGTTVEGEAITIGPDDGPGAVIFLAHWCPHCQAEVEALVPWLEDGGLPESVSLSAVATSNDPGRQNFPASDWLAEEGWPVPTLLDDGEDGAARAAGVTAFPFWVFFAEDGTVAGRTTGALPVDLLEQLLQELGGDLGGE